LTMPTLCSVKLRSTRDVCGGAMAPYYNHVAPLCTKRRLSMIPVAKQKPVPTNQVVLLCCRLHAAKLLYLEKWTNYILEDWTRHAAMRPCRWFQFIVCRFSRRDGLEASCETSESEIRSNHHNVKIKVKEHLHYNLPTMLFKKQRFDNSAYAGLHTQASLT